MPSPDRADESASLSMSSTEPLNAPGALQVLDGQFAFMTVLRETFLTAVGGGGRTTDTVHTDATVPRSWEMFRLWTTNASGFYGIQTLNGHFVTAVDAGGYDPHRRHEGCQLGALRPCPVTVPTERFRPKN